MEVVQCVNEPKICFSHAYHIVRGGLRRRSCHLHHVCLHVVAFFLLIKAFLLAQVQQQQKCLSLMTLFVRLMKYYKLIRDQLPL